MLRRPGPRPTGRRRTEGRPRDADARLASLASFPEENPNAVIEITAAGTVTYMNPVARKRFPGLRRDGFAHPILRSLDALVAGSERGHHPSYITREIESGPAAYEQKICFTHVDGGMRLRIYTHDITRRKRAEEALHTLARRVVFAQEEERHRVSRELHDEAGQALTALKLSLELITADLPADGSALRHNLQEAIGLIDTTRERIRSLARGLRPPSLDTLGLNLTLQALCHDFSRLAPFPVTYRGTEVSGLSAGATISLYRVLQEALTNVARHAQASAVRVTLAQTARAVRLLVADNGRGFDARAGASPPLGDGIGLRGMRERLELFGGRLEIQSAAGRGVRLTAYLPREDA